MGWRVVLLYCLSLFPMNTLRADGLPWWYQRGSTIDETPVNQTWRDGFLEGMRAAPFFGAILETRAFIIGALSGCGLTLLLKNLI